MSREMEDWLRSRARELQPQREAKGKEEQPARIVKSKPRLTSHRRRFIIGAVSLMLISIVVLTLWLPRREPSFFSKEIRQNTPFQLYYPDIKKLPSHYNLDHSSISANGQAVIYIVRYSGDKRIAFSIQQKPPENELKTFNEQRLAESRMLQTDIGIANLAELNGQSIASLPTKDGSWIIVTAPPDINQEDFAKVISSLRR